MNKFHIILRQYRVVAVALTIFFAFLTWDMWTWFKISHAEMKEWAVGGFVSLALLAMGTVKWSLENFMKKIEKDDHDWKKYEDE